MPQPAADTGIRDNHTRGTVASFLTEKIQEGSALSIVSAYFTIYAYDALKQSLDRIQRLNFLFGEPSFVNRLDPSKTEKKAFIMDSAGLGLRVSELLALRWEDVDFKTLELSVTRSIWHQVVGDCKTEASAKPVPLDSYMAEDLLRWRRISPYPMPHDWVFASPTMKGKQPYWPDNLMKRYIRPVAKAAGIHKRMGWHTFRHTFGTLLKANGEDIKTVQELLRHANSKITLEVYTQAMTSNKRAAQSKVVRMMVPNEGAVRVQKPA
jgi:integrase